MDIRFYLLVIGILGVWRVTHLLQAEDGPWDFVVRLRGYVGTGMWGRLMDCFYCLSLWIALPFALLCGEGWTERLLLWPALSAADAGEKDSRRRLDDRHVRDCATRAGARYRTSLVDNERSTSRQNAGEIRARVSYTLTSWRPLRQGAFAK